jgi:hypothetical protein
MPAAQAPPISAADVTTRDALTARVLPEMTLGTGAPGSLTAPLPPLLSDLSASQRAAERFAVKGNAISMI